MKNITATKAGFIPYKLIDATCQTGEPIQITGKQNNAVLISEQDWHAIRDTLYLFSIPGMRKPIRKGLKVPVGHCVTDLKW